MNYGDHNPPHFHAVYGDYEVSIEIETSIVTGTMPGRALKMLLEWLELHRQELWENWMRTQEREPVVKVAPLV